MRSAFFPTHWSMNHLLIRLFRQSVSPSLIICDAENKKLPIVFQNKNNKILFQNQ